MSIQFNPFVKSIKNVLLKAHLTLIDCLWSMPLYKITKNDFPKDLTFERGWMKGSSISRGDPDFSSVGTNAPSSYIDNK